MSLPKIVFADADSVGAVNFVNLQQQGQLQLINKNKFVSNPTSSVHNAQIIITNKVIVDENLIKQTPELKLVCVAATGYNNIDLAECKKRQIAVCNVKDYSSLAVAQHTFALLLAWLNKISAYHQSAVDGTWPNSPHFCLLDFPIADLADKNMGIFGYGNIGKSVANIAQAFGMKVLIAERKNLPTRPGRMAYEDVIRQADVISLHCPLTNDNQKMVNEAFLTNMKSSAILVNTARGGLIDEVALLNALQQQRIQAALLDGLTTEPPAANNPLLTSGCDNLMITPHVAWASIHSRQKLIDEIALNIQAFFAGKIRNRLDV